jgi:hypothetical protein
LEIIPANWERSNAFFTNFLELAHNFFTIFLLFILSLSGQMDTLIVDLLFYLPVIADVVCPDTAESAQREREKGLLEA